MLHRRRSGRALQVRRRRAWLTGLVVLAACGGAVVAIRVAAAPTTEHTVSSAWTHADRPYGGGHHGYGKGGYPMMPHATEAVAMASGNWSGYVAAAAPGSFTSVSSSWTQPAVTCGTATTFSSFWVGLDGAGTPTVEQTGTEADCSNGTASYAGWYEIFPDAPVFYNEPVQPGDAMSASVTAQGGGAFTLTLNDTTQGWTKTTNQVVASAQLGSAEIIAEAPSSQTGVLPLADFGTVNFTGATVDGQPIDNTDPAPLTLVSAAGAAEATPSTLDGQGGFSVTSNVAAPGTGTGTGTGLGTGAGTGTGTGTGTATDTGSGTGAGAAAGTGTDTSSTHHRHRHHGNG